MNTNKILIKTSNKNYSIVIGRNLIGKIDKILKDNRLKFDKCLIVTDKNIPHKFKRLLYKKLKTNKLVKIEIAASEKNRITEQLKKSTQFYLKTGLIGRTVLFLLVGELLEM